MTKLHTLLEEQLFKLQVHTLSSGYDVNHRTQQINLSSALDVISKALDTEVQKVIGGDLPLEQPFDDEMDGVELMGNTIFRKGANWAKAEQRKAWNKVMEEK